MSLEPGVRPGLPNQPKMSTQDLLHYRKRAGSKPGQRDDGRTLALVIEGGAMRGVISAGMTCALEQNGLRDCFDAVYGSSAGAICGAYFVAGQAQYGASIFYEDINNRKFIDLRRLLMGKPVVSLEYLLDEVCAVRKPLSFDRIVKGDIALKVLATSISRKQAIILSDFTSAQDLLDALRASARIPYFAGAPVAYRADRLIDASLFVSIPFQAAINDQATDIVILLTRPLGRLRQNPSWIVRSLVAPYIKRIDPALWDHYLARPASYAAEIDAIRRCMGARAGPKVMVIPPPAGVPYIGPFELDRRKLKKAAQAGFNSVHAALEIAERGA
jgi:predicted patatin/cPLA2 family phospholipase